MSSAANQNTSGTISFSTVMLLLVTAAASKFLPVSLWVNLPTSPYLPAQVPARGDQQYELRGSYGSFSGGSIVIGGGPQKECKVMEVLYLFLQEVVTRVAQEE